MKYSLLRLAHRGFSGLYPENTILAFKKAIESGVEFLGNGSPFNERSKSDNNA